MWTNRFKEFCEDLLSKKQLKSIKNYSTTKDVHFVLTESKDGIICNQKNLKLHSYIYTSNMVLFDENNCLKKYDTTDEIIDNFCKIRLSYYVKRKKHQIKNLENSLRHLSNKQRFILEVISKKLKIMNVSEKVIVETLRNRKYDEDSSEGGYDYLLRLQVRTFTAEKVDSIRKEIEKVEKAIKVLKKTSEQKIWLSELKELEKHYEKWLKDLQKRKSKKKKR